MNVSSMTKTKKLVYASVLSALIVLMAFTPVGYLKVGTIEVTFLTVPVCIGAILLGEYYGMFLGLVFGLTSFAQCFGLSAFGSFILSESALGAFITTVLARTAMGYLSGKTYKFLSKHDEKGIWSFIVSSVLASAYNTVLFVGAFMLFFAKSDLSAIGLGGLSALNIIVAIVGVNGIIEIIVCGIISALVSRVLVAIIKRGIK